MNVSWTRPAWEDYLRWQVHDPKIRDSINTLIIDVAKDSFRQLGDPQQLKGAFEGWRSRRIRGEHRLVYRVVKSGDDARVEIVQCCYHT